MKSVYETSIGIEAHMVKNLLMMSEIESEIIGEHLQGGIGDLHAVGIIRVMVAYQDYEKAHKVIAEWETSQPKLNDYEKRESGLGYGSLLFAFVLGVFAVILVMGSPVETDGIDYNGDGVLDEKWLFIGEMLNKIEVDRNRDGEIDIIWRYDLEGLLKSSSLDNDFDRVFETECRIREGNLTWCHRDIDNDGFAEYRENYKLDVLHTVSMFNPISKQLKKKQYFEAAALRRAELDLDDDGVLETIYLYDSYEELK